MRASAHIFSLPQPSICPKRPVLRDPTQFAANRRSRGKKLLPCDRPIAPPQRHVDPSDRRATYTDDAIDGSELAEFRSICEPGDERFSPAEISDDGLK